MRRDTEKITVKSQQLEVAEKDGRIAYEQGLSVDYNPYNPQSQTDEFVAWEKGYANARGNTARLLKITGRIEKDKLGK